MKKRLLMLLLTVVCAIAGAQALTVKGTAVDQAKMNQFIDDLMGKMTLQENRWAACLT